MKSKLLKMLKTEEEARRSLVERSKKSEDINELRGIQSQIESSNSKIAEIKNLLNEIEESLKEIGDEASDERGGEDEDEEDRENDEDKEDDESERTKTINRYEKRTRQRKQESRKYMPGRGFSPVDGGKGGLEDRSKNEKAERTKRGKEIKEGRAVTIGSNSIILPQHQASDIRPTFNEVSSLVDRVTYKPLMGGESFKQPYIKGYGIGGYTNEGEDYTETQPIFGYAEINKAKITAYSEDTEELQKLPAADYDGEVMKNISIATRKQITREILIGSGANNSLVGIFSSAATAIDPATDLELSDINNNTLDEIIFTFGGDEDVEDAAVLILNKNDLKTFSKLRTADGKKFHTIVTNGNTGTIDGIPFIINSVCKAISVTETNSGDYCMAYGPLSNYLMAVFSDMDIQRSTDYKFRQGMIAHKGSVFLGGNVVSKNGFLRVKKGVAI